MATDFRQDLNNEYFIIDVTDALLTAAMDLAETHGLRAYDAVQLAAVHSVDETRNQLGLSPVTLISADLDLNTAATAIGIPVDDPNTHP